MKGTEYTLSKDGKLLAKGPLRYDTEFEYFAQFGQYTSAIGSAAATFVDPIYPDVVLLVILEDSE